ncbi:MAG: hypothetical protein WC303_01455 [Candidatus Paceibacterota bacterium]|jgi:hypothetical protein
MKKQHLIIGLLLITFVFVGSAYAAQNGGAGANSGTQNQQQTQTVNQGENIQIKIENNEQTQTVNNANQNETNGAQIQQQSQQQTQQNLQDGTGNNAQVQNQVKNQENTQVQNNNQETQAQSGLINAQQRRSQVANAAQEMLQVAERNTGIGQEIKIIAQTQTQNQEKIEESLQKVQSRNEFVKFFVGPNYAEISNAEKILEQNREQIQQLNQIKTQLSGQADQQVLTQQAQLLEQANLEIESVLESSQKGFSLFGWVFRLFSR